MTVCIPCKISSSNNELKCSRCHKEMRFVSPKIEVPKKTDDKGWRKLQDALTNRTVGELIEERAHKKNINRKR